MVRKENDLTGWLLFFLEAVENTAKYSIRTLKNIFNLKENLENRIRKNSGMRAPNNLNPLTFLFGKLVVCVKNIQTRLSAPYLTAKHVIDDLTHLSTFK